MLKPHALILLLSMSLVTKAMSQDKSITLFPGVAPGEKVSLTETADTSGGKTGGKIVTRITNVDTPVITVYRAKSNTPTPAVMVCPGGGYNILAYDLEGTEVCEWLNKQGITAILLKYRVPRRSGIPKHEAPLQDAQRGMSYIRAHAKELNINPSKIGIMGFSAGAHLSVMTSNSFDTPSYKAIDAYDTVSCRPDFCILIYPAYLDGNNFNLAEEIKTTKNTPPTIIIQAEDDKNFINSSLFYYYALKNNDVPATMHLYSKGGHGFGLRDTINPVKEWPVMVEKWLKDINESVRK